MRRAWLYLSFAVITLAAVLVMLYRRCGTAGPC